MTDLEPILSLWRELEAAKGDYVLATIVAVEGSSYRRPGAHMLIAEDGRRAGTVSGGCLEAEVAKRAWWRTTNGPVVEQFSTLDDDGERPFGSGCGGVLSILLERRTTAAALLGALESAFNRRVPLAVVTVLDGPRMACRAFAGLSAESIDPSESVATPTALLRELAQKALDEGASCERSVLLEDKQTRVRASFSPARAGLWIFGAGDDARPLLRLARELGWFGAVADGRSHLATRERFPSADAVFVLDISALPGAEFARLDVRSTDAAVVMTHSFAQDSRVVASLLSREPPPAYIGVLGPQRRTRELLAEAANLLDLPAREDQIVRWLAQIHAPTGLDIAADTPASIALSILAEAQQILHQGTGKPLGVVRADTLAALRP